MTDHDLRDQLAGLGAPGTPPPGATDRVLAAVRRRERRRRRLGALAGAAAVAVAGVAIGVFGGVPDRAAPPVTPADRSPAPTETWAPIAESPLSPRWSPITVWTGREMWVLGGRPSARPCPPDADCTMPAATADGAAYDPGTDTWRPLPDLPARLGWGHAVVTDDAVVVIGDANEGGEAAHDLAAWSIDPDGAEWRRIGDVPTGFGGGAIWDGERLVSTASEGGRIWALDPATGDLERLPDDPWGATYDRTIVWSGEAFYLTALMKDDDTDGFGRYRLARLRPDESLWTDLGETPVSGWDPTWYWHDGELMNPTQYALSGDQDGGSGGIWNPEHGWREGAQLTSRPAEGGTCLLPAVGLAGDWLLTYGGGLVSNSPDTVRLTPPCPDFAEVYGAVWTGEELIAWGGSSADWSQVLDRGLRWAPPQPEDVR